jgi:hypothetical protein
VLLFLSGAPTILLPVKEGATANYFFFNASTIRLLIFCLPGLGAVLAYPDPTVSLVLHCLQLMRPFFFHCFSGCTREGERKLTADGSGVEHSQLRLLRDMLGGSLGVEAFNVR